MGVFVGVGGFNSFGFCLAGSHAGGIEGQEQGGEREADKPTYEPVALFEKNLGGLGYFD